MCYTIIEITSVLEKSNDPEELKYYWLQWYNKAGAPVRSDFDKYAELNHEAAVNYAVNISLYSIWCIK